MEYNLSLFQQTLEMLTKCRTKWDTCSTNSEAEVETWRKLQLLCEDIVSLETPELDEESDADDDTEINYALRARARM